MAKEIILENVIKHQNTVSYALSIDGKPFVLDYKITTFACAIDINKIEARLDPVLLTLIYHAARFGYDFRSTYPVTTDLLYRVTYQLVPQLRRCAPAGALQTVNIHAPMAPSNAEPAADWNGLKITCDIESLAALYEYSRMNELAPVNITHIVYLGTDAVRDPDMLRAEIDNIKHFRERSRRSLVVIESNVDEVIRRAFEDVDESDYERSHTFRDCGAVAVLQDYFSRFNLPTAVNLDEFNIDITRDCSYYERWFLPFISSRRLQFWVADCHARSSLEKMQLIDHYSYTFDTLHVCRQNARNCGHCDDCIYTLVALDALDLLKRYASVFDLDDYRAHRAEFIRHIFEHRHEERRFAALYRRLPDEWKSDDCVWQLSTYHKTDVYLDGKDNIWHRPLAAVKGEKYPLYARLNGDKRATLFIIRDKEIKYVSAVENSRKLSFTDTPSPVEIETVVDGTIAIRHGNLYLTALPRTNNFMLRTFNVVWEHYFLSEAPFTFNELSELKNFVPINNISSVEADEKI